MTNKEQIDKYEIMEKEGRFNEHVNPIDWDNALEVKKDFPYYKKSIKQVIKDFFLNNFKVKPFTKIINKLEYKTIVLGRENLKGIKRAIITSNHVFIYDCLVNKYALRGHKVMVVGAEFNNQKGKFGDLMRAGGLLPLSSKYSVMKEFNKGIKYHLNKNHYVLIYPEQSMWYNYEKLRPFKDGAFHYAVMNNVPVIPIYITFRPTGKYDDSGAEKKYVTVNILKPIYKNDALSDKENIKMMKDKDFNACKEVYEKTYNKPLKYTNDNN